MKFSIVTITFNAEAYLEETLQSVADQTFGDLEHIVWDGGSTDKTLEIVKKFPHVTLHQGEDEGIADAMNRGASFANGEFLLHLHADDRLAHPRVLAELETFLRARPGVRWLCGRVEVINEEGESQRTTNFEPNMWKKLPKYNCIAHPATLVERALFEKEGGFQPRWRYCMDYDLWLRLLNHTHPHPYPGVVSHFREHSHSLSTSEPLAVTDEAYHVRNQYIRSPLQRWRSYRTWKRRRKRCLQK